MSNQSKIQKTYVTFGQSHAHQIGSQFFNKDCIAIVEGGRDRVFELFGDKWCFEYTEKEWEAKGLDKSMHYFPRGYMTVGDIE